MNMLNSLILEGNVVDGLSSIPDCSIGGKDFGIEVIRYYKKADGEMIEDKSYFRVEIYGNMTDEKFTKNIYVGRGIRVVGRLKQKRWKDEEGKLHSRIVVIAEHIEFKNKICDKKSIEPSDMVF